MQVSLCQAAGDFLKVLLNLVSLLTQPYLLFVDRKLTLIPPTLFHMTNR